VSNRQALGAGFAIGVSNLNRRKMRTALTCTTLVILTFTVMSFTNVKNSVRTVRTRIADEAAYRGLLIRSQFGIPLTLLTQEDFKVRFDPEKIWPKGWIKPVGLNQRNVTTISANGRSSPVEGILGVGRNAPDSIKKVLLTGTWFEKKGDNSILLPLKLAVRLGLNPKDIGAPVQLMGSTFRVAGIFDDTQLESFKDLDQKPILPAYLETGNENVSEAETEAIQSGEQVLPQTQNYRYADAGRTVLIPFETNISLGGNLETIAVLTDSNPSEAAEGLTSWLAYPVFTGDGGAWYESTSTAIRYQGAGNLLVPILIVVLITLNTMISHVYERKREIATYTSVGLAPAHVGFLFIVEALSLAVISTVFGYILAQFSAHFLAGTFLFSQLTFNYSSLASVACMLLVFSVVFLAALYPARVATTIAMPDVNRIWRLPEPEGDQIRMNLPFLLKAEEEYGIMNFLLSYFVSHIDSGHGSFTIDDTRLDMGTPLTGYSKENFEACLIFQANAWLAPFDFGIKQRVHLHCCPSEHDPGYLEIAIFLTRLSGERSGWARANKRFVKDLRKRILLWRLLDAESKAAFLPSA
jgi:ABC-type antimicrobial peptide transport system permease subunit